MMSFGRLKPAFTLQGRDVQLYRLGDDLSGLIILPMLVLSPWLFGTTPHWAIWGMNFGGYLLGFLLLGKLFIREVKGYVAPRWDNYSSRSGRLARRRHPLKRVLAGLTLAVLAYILVSALNRAADYSAEGRVFQYHPHLKWLPYSLDGGRTWFYFWMYLGLAASFWAICDWLPGMTVAEELAVQAGRDQDKAAPWLTARLRTLLWLLCINGTLVGVESIIQRACYSTKLLFLEQPLVNPDDLSQFGPYGYRANAAQFFNLVWPLALGFWWTLQRAGGLRGKAQHWLLLCAAIMAACPIISTSRGGALVSAGIMAATLGYLGWTSWRSFVQGRPGEGQGTSGWLFLFLTAALVLGWFWGWKSLAPRMEQIGGGYQYREAIYADALPMAADYPVFGTGPGTFATVFQLYRFSESTYWPEQLHNDWLETRITFGWFGFSLLLAALACVGLASFSSRHGLRRLVVLAGMALAGCLIHARFDLPFQVHSTLLLFLVICALLLNLSRPAGAFKK
jgi:hypothetical protein